MKKKLRSCDGVRERLRLRAGHHPGHKAPGPHAGTTPDVHCGHMGRSCQIGSHPGWAPHGWTLDCDRSTDGLCRWRGVVEPARSGSAEAVRSGSSSGAGRSSSARAGTPGLALRVRRWGPRGAHSHSHSERYGASRIGGCPGTAGAALPRICGWGHVVRAAATSNSDGVGVVGAVWYAGGRALSDPTEGRDGIPSEDRGKFHGSNGATDVPMGSVCRVPATRRFHRSAASYGYAGTEVVPRELASSRIGDVNRCTSGAGATTTGYGDQLVATGDGPRTAEHAKLGGEIGGDSNSMFPAYFAETAPE